MKVSPSIRKICQKCKTLRRYKKLYVICINLKHKQRQK